MILESLFLIICDDLLLHIVDLVGDFRTALHSLLQRTLLGMLGKFGEEAADLIIHFVDDALPILEETLKHTGLTQ